MTPSRAAEVTQQVKIGKFKIPTEALRAYTMMFALVAIWLFFQWATVDARNPYGLFLSAVNFSKLMQQTAVTGVLAVGMLMVIVCGQIDLSVGSMVGLAGAIAAMSQGRGLLFTLAAAIVIGVVVGAFQGALVAYVNMPAFIVTLGGLLAWPGVSFWRTQGATIPVEIPSSDRWAATCGAAGWICTGGPGHRRDHLVQHSAQSQPPASRT